MVSFGNQYRSGGSWWSRRRAWWSRRSDTTRFLIVAGTVALVTWLAWPYIKGAIGRNGHQQRHTYGDAPRTVDRYGLLPRGDDGYAEGSRRGWRPRGEGDYAEPLGGLLRFLPGSGHAGNRNADGLPRDQQRRPYQWRECTGSRQHPHCGPWHDGPAPGDK
jgi:hypothetical protein